MAYQHAVLHGANGIIQQKNKSLHLKFDAASLLDRIGIVIDLNTENKGCTYEH